MGLVESVVGDDPANDDEFDGFSDEEDGPDGTGLAAMPQSDPYPMKGLRVLSVEQGSPAACSKLLAWVQPPLGGGASTTGPLNGLTSFADVILSANGIECVSIMPRSGIAIQWQGPTRIGDCLCS
jgi:hypothetical protein